MQPILDPESAIWKSKRRFIWSFKVQRSGFAYFGLTNLCSCARRPRTVCSETLAVTAGLPPNNKDCAMKMTFRWFGDSDPVTLPYIRQIPGMTGVVSAIYDIPVGEVWPLEKIAALKARVNAHGLELEVIESVPVHEDIKRGLPSRDQLIDNYGQTLRNLAACGIKVVCYNFMPVFDWTRSTLAMALPDGSTTLAFDVAVIEQA